MTRAAALAACAALVAVDALARACRLQRLVSDLGGTTALAAAAASNAVADVAAALTPLRLGGLPAHAIALVRLGVALPVATAALAVEAVLSYPTVALLAIPLVTRGGRAWWDTAVPALVAALRGATPLLPSLAVACGLALWSAPRLRRRLTVLERRLAGAQVPRPRLDWRALRASTLALGVLLTAVQVGARIALLPVLARTADAPPPTPVVALGSFALLYGQLALPTPSGLGAVELLGAGGAAGALGASTAWVLAWWRTFTTFGAALLSTLLALTAPRRRS